MDSIRENEKLDDMITILKMELSADIDDSTSIVLVEGSDDKKFINRFFSENVISYESFSGKRGLQELIEVPELQENRIIAIRDRDYADENSFPERMFCYDSCCLETMLVSCEEVRNSIFDMLYSGIHERNDFMINVMRELSPLSIFRQKNEQNRMNVNFKKLGLGDFIDKVNETIDHQALFNKIGQTSETLVECMEEAVHWTDEVLYEKTNGHDLCVCLGKILKIRGKELGEKKFRDILLCVYRKSDFKYTALYNKLLSYQEEYRLAYVD